MRRIGYFVARALKGMRQALFVNAVAVVTIAIALLVVTVFVGVAGQVRSVLEAWGRDITVTVYLSHDVTAAQRQAVAAAAKGLAGKHGQVAHVTAAAALGRLRQALGPQADVLDGLAHNPLPESYGITGAADLDRPKVLSAFATRVRQLPGVDDVDYGQQWVGRLERLVDLFGLVGLVLGGLILLAAAVMVSNTIKLAVFSRRDEIEIMKLCGATDAFVRAPFLIEGLLQGVLGALLAAGIAAGLWALAVPRMEAALMTAFAVQVHPVLPWADALWLVAGGGVLGLTGSGLSLGRFLDV